jgi:hypothetical protein
MWGLLICYWFVADLLLICYWFVADLLLICYWFVTDLLLICCWFVADLLLICYWLFSVVTKKLRSFITPCFVIFLQLRYQKCLDAHPQGVGRNQSNAQTPGGGTKGLGATLKSLVGSLTGRGSNRQFKGSSESWDEALSLQVTVAYIPMSCHFSFSAFDHVYKLWWDANMAFSTIDRLLSGDVI